MPVDSSLEFPIEKSVSIRNMIYANLMSERSKGARWSVTNKIEEGVVNIKRVS